MSHVRIVARRRGPLCVEGDVELVDLDGCVVDTEGRARLLLCRCGASRTKPLCDGSHNRTGFESDE
jgi:CDGSH-type Zn-finger protein